MSSNDLIFRVQRLYVAVGAAEETDISKFKPQVISDGSRVGFYQDWSGGRSDAELANTARMLIYNIANLKDVLKKWAVRNGKDKTKVDNSPITYAEHCKRRERAHVHPLVLIASSLRTWLSTR